MLDQEGKPVGIRLQLSILLFSIVIVVLGCASGKRSEKAIGHSMEGRSISLQEAESGFDPSAYNPPIAEIESTLVRQWASQESKTSSIKLVTERKAGFRVQVLMTKDIDEATQSRITLQSVVPADSVYVVFEPPYYKVRVGNFLTRPEAAELMQFLHQRGFPDAWIVPDQVTVPAR